MESTKPAEKTIIEMAKTQQSSASKSGGNKKSTNKMLRAMDSMDEGLGNLRDFPELHAELTALRNKLFTLFIDLKRSAV